jgi:APA family basic amino acid/polyamine antiporter
METPNEKLVRGLGPLDATIDRDRLDDRDGHFYHLRRIDPAARRARLLLAWVMAGVLTITGALRCAELAAMLPRAGGQYVFLHQAYGPSVGFLFGWTPLLVIQTGPIAAVAIALARFAGVFLPVIAT